MVESKTLTEVDGLTVTYDTNEGELTEHKQAVLKGIRENLAYPEIASQLGVSLFTLRKEVWLMRRYGDKELVEAESMRMEIKSKNENLNPKSFVVQENRFLNMTGMTLEEKTFQNMVEFYRPALIAILRAKDQAVEIGALPKRDRTTLFRNEILQGGRNSRTWILSARAKKYLRSQRSEQSALLSL